MARYARVLVMVIALITPLAGQGLPPESGLVWTTPDRFWFRRTVPGGHLWLNVDGTHGAKEPLFDHQRLAIELGLRTGNEFTPLTLPLAAPDAQFVVKYDGSNAYIQEGAMAIEFVLYGAGGAGVAGGMHWRCDLQIKWNWNLVPPTDYECLSRRSVVPGVSDLAKSQPATRVSPDGRWEAFVQAGNVMIRPAGGGDPGALSTDGTAAFGYHAGSLAWSADSRQLSAYRVHEQVWLSPAISGNVKSQVVRATFSVK